MKRLFLAVTFCVLGLVLLVGGAHALTINFATLENANLTFIGSTDTFVFNNNSSGYSFNITAETEGSFDDLVGLHGKIEGTYKIGSFTPGLVEYASVTNVDPGPHQVVIFDGTVNFTAQLNLVDIFTFGAQGGMNNIPTPNLTNADYDGANPDLIALTNFINDSNGTITMAFSFKSPKSLSTLTSDDQVNSTAFSGTLSAIPIPGSVLLLGTGVLGLALLGFRRKKKV